MQSLQSLYDDAIFRLSALTWLEGLDLLLIVITFYLLLAWAQRKQAAFLLRGALLLGVILFIVTIVLPLPTFDWLVRGALLSMLITIPIIFQPEIRRFLEQLGRRAGINWTGRQTAAESNLSELAKAVGYFSAHHIGVLIVLEGNELLTDIIETGVTVSGPITEDLLQAIFYGENPLHDGAVILREDQVVAAGCVLPLTTRPLLQPGHRLGTRHRAAVGLSETSDALVVVVSEETGEISVAYRGVLYRPLTLTALRERLFDFYQPSTIPPPKLSLRGLTNNLLQTLKQRPSLPTTQQLFTHLGLFFMAILLALTFWSFVIDQTNPARRVLVENIPLRLEDTSSALSLMTPLPESVSAIIQTTEDVIIRRSAFQASVSLQGLSAGLHQVEVQVTSGLSPLRILSVDPTALDLELAPIISQTFSITIDLANQENMSPAFQMVRVPLATPNEVQIVGPQPLVNKVSQVRARISLANASGSFQELLPLEALDDLGRPVSGLTLQPAQAQISVTIQRRLNALDVGVRAITENSPPAGYWLSDLRVTPASLTLQGDPSQLAELESYVDTLPIDISQASGDFTMDIPLNLPASIQAVDSAGITRKTVTVTARITPRQGDLVLTKEVELLGSTRNIRLSIDPPEGGWFRNRIPLVCGIICDSRYATRNRCVPEKRKSGF
jgi:diadenylate cyclase